MKRAYKFRLYPTPAQVRQLDRIVEVHRQVYNDALLERNEAWRMCRQSVNYYTQSYQLKAIREFDDDVAWCNYSSLQQTLRRLQKAFDAFFRRVAAGTEKPGYPKYKNRRTFRSVCYVYNDGIRFKRGRLYIQHVGRVRIFQHRPIPENAHPKMVMIMRDKARRWYAVFQIELPNPVPVTVERPAVGIDMGLEHFAALSTGELIANPRWFREAEQQLATLQRQRARCQRGSRRYRELSRRIARLHDRTAQKRHDFHHQLANRLAGEFGLIAVESLNINGLARSHVSKSIGDVGWGQFLQVLEYKTQATGGNLVKVAAHGTSQVCPECDCTVRKELAERQHRCPECGYTAPRDVAAARVILARGLNEPARTESPA